MDKHYVITMVVIDRRLVHAPDEATARRQALALANKFVDSNDDAFVVTVEDVTTNYRAAIKQRDQ